jgi:hypothetical protein
MKDPYMFPTHGKPLISLPPCPFSLSASWFFAQGKEKEKVVIHETQRG